MPVQARSPSGLTPLLALPMASLDFETTGLDPTRDRVIQIGLALLDGPVLLREPRVAVLVNPERPVPETAARITGIGDDRLAEAPRFDSHLPTLRTLIAGRVIIGIHVAFDLAILRAEATRMGLDWVDPPSLDIGLLLAALEPGLPDTGMESVTRMLGVEVSRRHDALADALAVAACFERLLPRLAASGVQTLAEARALIARRPGPQAQQADTSGQAGAGVSARVDGVVFARSLRDVMSAPPLSVPSGTGVLDAARMMVERRVGALLVGEADRPPLGIVTERDLLTRFSHCPPESEGVVDQVMSAPVQSLEADELLYRALGRMDRLGIRHLAVTDGDGVACGMVSQRDLLHHRARSELLMRDATATAATEAALATAFARVPEVAEGLLEDGLDGRAIARVVGRELQAVTARMAGIARQRMENDGLGPPPASFAVLVLGSGGRGESLLGADQDNALVHAGGPEDDDWFARFGALLADGLAVARVRRCDGGVMASNAAWRGSAAEWRDRIGHWLSRARPEDLLNVDIFFDLAPVYGDTAQGDRLRSEAIAGAARTRPFLGLLARSVTGTVPRLGLFGRLPVEKGRVDLKRHGLLPLVSLARALALALGTDARSTGERLDAVRRAGRLGAEDIAGLLAFQNTCMTLILRQQVQDMHAGRKPSNRVRLSGMSAEDRRRLRSGMARLGAIASDVPALIGG